MKIVIVYFINISKFLGTHDPYKRSCTKFEKSWVGDSNDYEYVIPKGSFCSDYCKPNPLRPKMKEPIWFECSKTIMPKIYFYFDDEKECTVKTKHGKMDSDVQKCLEQVKIFLFAKGSRDVKLVYLAHGYKGKDFRKSKNFKAIKNNLMEKYKEHGIVIGVVNWITGSRLFWPKFKAGRSLFRKNGEANPSTNTRNEDDDHKATKTAYCCTNRAIPGKPHKCLLYYPTAAANTWPIGNILAYVSHELVKDMKKKKISTFCIGHSLGSHLCGFFSKRVKELGSNLNIEKIIGMDPAGPVFQDKKQASHLKLAKEDALQVEIHHTNTKRYGFKIPLGFDTFQLY